jgi:hypothetical protein
VGIQEPLAKNLRVLVTCWQISVNVEKISKAKQAWASLGDGGEVENFAQCTTTPGGVPAVETSTSFYFMASS